MSTYSPLTDDDAAEILAETVHTAFRKGCEGGAPTWKSIQRMDPVAWSAAVDWMIWCLDVMDFKICQKDKG